MIVFQKNTTRLTSLVGSKRPSRKFFLCVFVQQRRCRVCAIGRRKDCVTVLGGAGTVGRAPCRSTPRRACRPSRATSRRATACCRRWPGSWHRPPAAPRLPAPPGATAGDRSPLGLPFGIQACHCRGQLADRHGVVDTRVVAHQ